MKEYNQNDIDEIIIKGIAGKTPIKGEDYFDGKDGKDGEKGERGEKGDRGEKGEKGEQGISGKDGKNGKDGKAGRDGKDGKNGSPDTPKQVKEKLLKIGLDYNELDNTPDINKVVNIAVAGVKQSSKTYSIPEMEDVKLTNLTNADALKWNSTTNKWENGAVASSTTWGSITGTLSNQTDLQTALDLKVPTSRTLTINGTAYDLSADRSWSVGTVTSVAALTLGTTGTDLSSSVATGTTTPVITLNVPTASATNRGALSSTDWTTFNNKFTLPSLTSGSVLFSNGTTIAQDNANFFWNDTNSRLGIGTASPAYSLDVTGDIRSSGLYRFSGSPTISNASSALNFNADNGFVLNANNAASNLITVSNAGVFGFTSGFTSSYTNPWMSLGLLRENSSQWRGNIGYPIGIHNLAGDISFTQNTGVTYGAVVVPTETVRFKVGGYVGIGQSSPTAVLHLKAGTATASTAPLKFTAGTNLTTIEAGVQEFTTGNFWFSPSTTNRIRIGYGGSGLAGATNLVIGDTAGTNLTTGSGANTYIGRLVGASQTNGIENTGLGSGALSVHTGYTANTAIGAASMYYGSGSGNTAIGYYAMFADSSVNTTVGAVAIGYQPFYKKTSGNYGIAIGYNAGFTVTSAANSIIIGYNAVNGGVHTGTNTIAIGQEAGKILTSGAYNNFIGYQSGATVTTGTQNNFMGYQAGYNTNSATGYANYIGYQAGYGTSTNGGVSNFIGYRAGYSATYSIQNNFIGNEAGYGAGNLADANFIGTGAGYTASNANRAVFIGLNAGNVATSAVDTIGIGNNAGRNATGSIESIFIGKNSGYNSVSTGVTGDYNIGFGTDTGKALTTGEYNILIGYRAGDAITTGSNNVIIGKDIDAQGATTSDQLSIQNAIFGTGNNGTGTTVSTGKIGIYTAAPTCALDVTGGIATSRTAVTAPATTDGNIFSGTYTPTLTGITNVTSSTAYVCQYMRVGNVVTVSGKIEVTPTANNTQTTIGISLPIASNFANSGECGGSSHTVANTTAGHGGAIYADATNDRAEMDYFETHGASDTFAFSFTYQII